MDNDTVTLKNRIFNDMITQIKADLTTGRSEENLDPYNDNKITCFIEQNIDKINTAVNDMYNYLLDEAKETIKNDITWEDDWIREFLYDCVKISLN